MEFKDKLLAHQKRVEAGITELLPAAATRPVRIHEAMLHSMQAGGKRLRPVLALATSELFGNQQDPLHAAIALECLHTYSLIHDDLPAIDDSDLRRGHPTCHKQFDEATAVLAGDALLTYTFQLIGRGYAQAPEIGMTLLGLIGETAGSERLIGGQMEDILGEERSLSEEELRFIHLNKTSALIETALEMGAVVGGATPEERTQIVDYGRQIGLAFQVIDDILDATSDAASLGKPVGHDSKLEKSTYVALYGIEESRKIANQLTNKALEICKNIEGDTSFLEGLATYLGKRLN